MQTRCGKQFPRTSVDECRAVIGANEGGRPLVITTCSAAKRQRRTATIEGLSLAPQKGVEAEWTQLLRMETTLYPVRTLYSGRGFQFARAVASQVQGDLAVVSAGLGYIKAVQSIPSYDLTVRSAGPGSIISRVKGGFDPVSWWRAVSAGPFASVMVEDVAPRSLTLICLSRSYAEMIAPDLERLTPYAARIRIFGQSLARHLPAGLQPCVLPYDERLDSVGRRGTRTDFAQRAMEHYVGLLGNNLNEDLGRAVDAVERSLRSARLPARAPQNRVSDVQIMAVIRRLWRQERNWTSSAMLRHARDVEGISCEQGRFRALFDTVAKGAAA